MQKPQAILFDLDGVLTDTSEYHYRAWKRLAEEEGITLTREENDAHLRGVARRESLMYILSLGNRQYSEDQIQEMMDRKNRYYTEMIKSMTIQEMMDRKNRYYTEMIKSMTPADLVPGGRQLLQSIRDAGIKSAVASASKNCRTVLERLDILNAFDGIADGYSVTNPKPAPDLFVYAAGLTKTPTSACLGVEDADAGIEAIKNAGMQALGIGPRDRFHRADKVLPTLANVSLQDILNN